ncbi:GMC oxidoreductase [Paraburkholderia sp. CNPSo 3281]|uniref:GMC oxidoreductase n=1 Tax=Paraburkholderia TaxID=1822464 RepID=UPI0035CD3929
MQFVGQDSVQINSVVDASGKVFGYEDLYVMDGAVIPRALGLNPSRTIAALAERNVALLIAKAGGAWAANRKQPPSKPA